MKIQIAPCLVVGSPAPQAWLERCGWSAVAGALWLLWTRRRTAHSSTHRASESTRQPEDTARAREASKHAPLLRERRRAGHVAHRP